MSELPELQGYSNSSRKDEAVSWSPPPRVGEGGFMPTAEAPLSSWAMLEQGEGGHGEREAPEAPTLLASSPNSCPFPAQPGYPAGLGQSKSPGAVEEVNGVRAPREGALGPREEGNALPPKTPH